MDLSKLTPAPWVATAGMVTEDRDYSRLADCTWGDVDNEQTAANCEFIALARNAFDVMMRRGWHPEPLDSGQWMACENRDGDWCDGPACADPFTALVEADRWYREHVEKV